MNSIRKYCFYQFLFHNFSHVDKYWEVMVDLALLFLAGVPQNRAFRLPVCRSHESFVLSGSGSMCQCYIDSVTLKSNINIESIIL